MKKIWYVVIGIIVILIITNPSVTAFKTYLGRDSYYGLKRPANLFICAFYKDHTKDYFGMIGNFWRLEPSKTDSYKSSLDSARIADSAKMAIDSSVHWQPPAKDSLISK